MRFNSHYQGQELICHHQQPSQWFGTAVCVAWWTAHTHRQHAHAHMCTCCSCRFTVFSCIRNVSVCFQANKELQVKKIKNVCADVLGKTEKAYRWEHRHRSTHTHIPISLTQTIRRPAVIAACRWNIPSRLNRLKNTHIITGACVCFMCGCKCRAKQWDRRRGPVPQSRWEVTHLHMDGPLCTNTCRWDDVLYWKRGSSCPST